MRIEHLVIDICKKAEQYERVTHSVQGVRELLNMRERQLARKFEAVT